MKKIVWPFGVSLVILSIEMEGIMIKPHKDGTKDFKELNYEEQANSINAQILNLEHAIQANIRRATAENRENPLQKRIQNIEDLARRLKTFI